MKIKQYKHINQYDRDRIEALLLRGHSISEISGILDRDKSTISREIARNRKRIRTKTGPINGPYKSTNAHQKSRVKRKNSKYQGKKINENNYLYEYIVLCLKKGWSPDDISGRMKKHRELFYVSKTSIYEWMYSVYGQRYCKYLYSKQYRPSKKDKEKNKKEIIPNRISISERSKKINKRETYGHYEGDTVVSGKRHHSKHALAVVYERKAKYVHIKKISCLKPKVFSIAMTCMSKSLSIGMESLTLDNGIENRYHEQIPTQTYFCDPYSSWQKGGIENANKMIRRYIPKGSDIKQYDEEYIQLVVNLLNNKPRKSLNYKTPLEVMQKNNLLKVNKKVPAVALEG